MQPTTESRKSGIEVVGDIPWGTHFCQFYRTREDLLDSLIPYIRTGLANNEFCLWVASPPLDADDARAMLSAAMPDLDTCIERGQLKIIEYSDWYVPNRARDFEAVLRMWCEEEKEARSRGYEGLRLTGNTHWVERDEWSSFMAYENQVNQGFGPHRIIALCTYCLDSCEPEGIIDVVQTHQRAIVRRNGQWDLIENSSLKQAKEALHKLNEELEQRVLDRTEQLNAALELRDEFLSLASHELRTPVASLKFYIQGILRAHQRAPLSPEELERRLQKAHEQCRRVDALVTNLLDVSLASTGHLRLHLEDTDLSKIARASADRFEEMLRQAACTLEVIAEAPVIGRWDRLRLEQILNNLLSNALRYAPGKPITLTVTATEDEATIVVHDKGIGIAPEDHLRVFERYAQLAPDVHPGGFGLGLWIVRQLVEALGGNIHLESKLGEGSAFTITLPRRLTTI